jgi:hypothetical protein
MGQVQHGQHDRRGPDQRALINFSNS